MQAHLRGKRCIRVAESKGIFCGRHLWHTAKNFCPACIGAPLESWNW